MSVARWSVVAIATLAFGVSGCGSDEERQSGAGGATATGESTKPAGKPEATVNVRETEFRLDPANPELEQTGVVRFKVKNAGKVVHALEVEGPDGEVQTPTLQPGKSATLKVNLSKPGSFEWYCPVGGHREQGMEGEIRVAGGGSGATTTEDSGGRSGETTTEDSGGGGGGY